MNFFFPWQTNERHTKIKRFTIDDASKQWLEKRVKNGLRKNTIIINKMSLRYLKDALGHARPLRSIELNDIERFIDHIRLLREALIQLLICIFVLLRRCFGIIIVPGSSSPFLLSNRFLFEKVRTHLHLR